MVVVTHEMDFARSVSNYVIFMEHGIMVEEGSPKQVFDHPIKERTRALLNTLELNWNWFPLPGMDCCPV